MSYLWELTVLKETVGFCPQAIAFQTCHGHRDFFIVCRGHKTFAFVGIQVEYHFHIGDCTKGTNMGQRIPSEASWPMLMHQLEDPLLGTLTPQLTQMISAHWEDPESLCL